MADFEQRLENMKAELELAQTTEELYALRDRARALIESEGERVQAEHDALRVEVAASDALRAAGCENVPALLSHVVARLTVVHPGEGDPPRVLAVGRDGKPLAGPRGPQTVEHVVRDIRNDPDLRRAGWG